MISPPPIDDLSALRRACELQPDEDVPQQALADCLTEGGEQGERDDVFRRSVAIRQQVGGLLPFIRFAASAVASPGWRPVAAELEGMAKHPENTDAFRRRYERLVRGDVPLDAEHLEQTLRLQYDLQVGLLTSLNLLEESDDGERFLTAIDGKRYPLPSFTDVLARMRQPEMQRKLTQGFDTLLLVPFGLPLERFTDAWRQGLKRNEPTLRTVGAFNKQDPRWVWDQYRTESLVYEPRSFTRNHGGKTKEQFLAADRGWDVLLVEGALQNLPRVGQGQSVGRRQQIECGRTPTQYLGALRQSGEIGLTPEAYMLHFLDALECRGEVLDTETLSYLTGAFLPTSRRVPGAYWVPGFGLVNLSGGDPGRRLANGGARAAVRVR